MFAHSVHIDSNTIMSLSLWMLWSMRPKQRTIRWMSGVCVGRVVLVGREVGLDRASVTVSSCRENKLRKYSPDLDVLCKFIWKCLVFVGTGAPMPAHRCQSVCRGAAINVLTGESACSCK